MGIILFYIISHFPGQRIRDHHFHMIDVIELFDHMAIVSAIQTITHLKNIYAFIVYDHLEESHSVFRADPP